MRDPGAAISAKGEMGPGLGRGPENSGGAQGGRLAWAAQPGPVRGTRVAARLADLPASSQGLVNLDQAGHDLPLRLGQRVLLGHQVLLQLGDPREIDDPCLVLGHGDLDGLFGILHAGGLELGALLGLQEGHQAVFHVLSGAQDGILVGGHQLLKLGILEANVIQDAPVVEDVPREGRTDVAGQGLGDQRFLKNSAEYCHVPLMAMCG